MFMLKLLGMYGVPVADMLAVGIRGEGFDNCESLTPLVPKADKGKEGEMGNSFEVRADEAAVMGSCCSRRLWPVVRG